MYRPFIHHIQPGNQLPIIIIMNKYHIIFLLLLNVAAGTLKAQQQQNAGHNDTDSLLTVIQGGSTAVPVVEFRSTRLILSQSVETVKKNNLNFEIVHRFGDFAGKNGGGQYFYGLDDIADVALRFEYGVTDNFNIDLERNTIGGLVDLGLKYALVHQSTGGGSPVAVTLYGEAGARPYGSFPDFSSRTSYFLQAIAARKFTPWFTLQVAPSFVADGEAYPAIAGIEKQFFAVNATTAIRITRHASILLDYAHNFSSYRKPSNGFYDPAGFGIQIETGGHVFTLNITNARAIAEVNYLSNTTSDFSKGQYRIGFTISRMFDFNHKEVYK